MPCEFSWSRRAECTHSSSLARRTAKAKSLKRTRDFPPRTGSARKAERCCAESKTRPRGSIGKRPIAPGNAAGKAQLARGIKKKKHALADPVALAARPQANPLRDGQIFAGSGAANRVLNVEGNGDGFDRLAACGGAARDRGHGSRKNGSGGAGNDGQVNRWARAGMSRRMGGGSGRSSWTVQRPAAEVGL